MVATPVGQEVSTTQMQPIVGIRLHYTYNQGATDNNQGARSFNTGRNYRTNQGNNDHNLEILIDHLTVDAILLMGDAD